MSEREKSSLSEQTNKGECFRKTSHPQTPDEGQGWEKTEVNDTLNTFDRGGQRSPTLVVYDYHRPDTRITECTDIACTVNSNYGTGGNNVPMTINNNLVVRHLTPREAERLQGFPDDWTNIGEWTDSKGRKRKCSDANRYKALGNSIAVGYTNNKQGFWCWLANRIVKQLKEDGVENPTMASLFDGIGGFPLAFSAFGCEPVWASEIEEFPIAVTKKHFPERTENKNERITNETQFNSARAESTKEPV